MSNLQILLIVLIAVGLFTFLINKVLHLTAQVAVERQLAELATQSLDEMIVDCGALRETLENLVGSFERSGSWNRELDEARKLLEELNHE